VLDTGEPSNVPTPPAMGSIEQSSISPDAIYDERAIWTVALVISRVVDSTRARRSMP
jgi:hypothetical protein